MLIMDVNGIYPLDGASAIEKENRRNYGGDNIPKYQNSVNIASTQNKNTSRDPLSAVLHKISFLAQ